MSLLTVAGAWAVLAADRGEPAKLDRRTLGVMFREAGARSLFATMRPLNALPSSPSPAENGPTSRPAVLLVPGLDVGRISLFFLEIFLRRRGWGPIWAVGRAGRDIALPSQASLLKRDIERLAMMSPQGKVDIVAFGTGGLVAAWTIRHHGADQVRRLVTIGTPWRGTRIAVFQRGLAALEVLPGSHLLDGLTPTGVPTTCIWSPDDPIVVPTSSALPEAGAQSVCIDGAGHLEMLASARVFRAVQAALEVST
jgi:triacylglycerol esterase/lipase EstA (alpha/beta hydrolase family)